MSRHTSFKPDSLSRAIAIRGLSFEAFAAEVGVDRETIDRANKGRPLRATTYKSIITTLSRIEPLAVPDGLVEETA